MQYSKRDLHKGLQIGILLALFEVWSIRCNLICNGYFEQYANRINFQAYTPFFRNSQTYFRGILPQDNKCWFLKNSTQHLQLKRVYNPPALPTYTVDLIGGNTINLSLCQHVTLQIGKLYNLSLDLYSNQNQFENETHVYLNSERNLLLSLKSKSYLQTVSGWTTFAATTQMNEICFVYLQNAPMTYKGPNLDNVKLVQIKPFEYLQQVRIMKKILTKNNSTKDILFQTDYYVPQQIRKELEQKIIIKLINHEQIKLSYEYVYGNNSALQIYVFEVFSYYCDITIEFPEKILSNITNINYKVTLEQSYQTSGLILISKVLKWIKMIGKTFLCSYLIFSLIGLWNLLLLYNFLFVSTLPPFAKIALDAFCTTFFQSNSLTSQITTLKEALDNFARLQDDQSHLKLPLQIKGSIWSPMSIFPLRSAAHYLLYQQLLQPSLFFVTICQAISLKKQKVINQERMYNFYRSDELFYFSLLHLFIPILVTAQLDFLFFVLVTIIIGIRLIRFYRKKNLFKRFQCFKLFAINIGWIIYQLLFLILWVINKAQLSDKVIFEYSFFINLSGVYIIFFIIFCGLVQIVDFLICLPSKFLKPLLKTLRLLFCMEKTKIRHGDSKQKIQDVEENIKTKKINRQQIQKFTVFNQIKRQKIKKTKDSYLNQKEILSNNSSLIKSQIVKQTMQKKNSKFKKQILVKVDEKN